MSVRAIRSLYLSGPVGRLEALLNEGRSGATHAALVCHPHPVYGGTMHNKVVFHAMKALHGFGFPVLRFNFRGAGRSQGEHDRGRGEVDDVRTALQWLQSEFRLPIICAGFSFGAATGLRAACAIPTQANTGPGWATDPGVVALIALGTPIRVDAAPPDATEAETEVRSYGYRFLMDCTKPKLFVSGGQDQFAPRGELEALVGRVPEPKQLVFIEGGDHFFHGHLPEMRAAVEGWVGRVIG